jgi:hypothetical protein
VRQSPRGLCRRPRPIFPKTYTRKTSSPAMTRQELEALIDEERTIAATGGTFGLGASHRHAVPDAWATEHFCTVCGRRGRQWRLIKEGRLGQCRFSKHRLGKVTCPDGRLLQRDRPTLSPVASEPDRGQADCHR